MLAVQPRAEAYLEGYYKTASWCEQRRRSSRQLPKTARRPLPLGHRLGLAFQVVDDILDFTGNDQQLGKPAAGDSPVVTSQLPPSMPWRSTPAFRL